MILSHRHKFLFFKQMKSAGSSIELALTPFCGQDDIMSGSPYDNEVSQGYIERNNKLGYRQVWNQHTSPSEFFDSDTSLYESYTKFTTIRNPYDAIVSYFWWSFYSPDSTLKNHILTPREEDNTFTLQNKFMTYLQTYASFSKVGNTEMIIKWFASKYETFYPKGLDHVLRYEDLEMDFSMLCGRIGLQPINLPKLKSNIRKSPYSYNEYYNPVSYDIVTTCFKNTIEDFNYTFDQ